jgi:eukaryotic-like serine/threonine-protein kinase
MLRGQSAHAGPIDAPEALLNQRIGRFRLGRRLGGGSIGQVFLALDDDSGQWVALKTFALDDAAASDERAEASVRFVREARTARQLNHPGIVSVLDAGEADGVAWIAMQAVAGTDLSRYTRPSRLLPEALVAQVGARVARALAHAHERGVVHRDVKPGNILVDWPGDVVKLTDFGVAWVAEHAQTRSGLALGSPDYMAPEQLAGGDVGPAADLYALGATLFELLTGRRPFQADTLGALLRAVALESAPDLQTLRPGLPPALCRAVLTALAKKPAARQPDATALADELQRSTPVAG